MNSLTLTLYILFEWSRTIDKTYCFEQLRRKTKVGKVSCTVLLICTEVFFGLYIKVLINLKILGQSFGIRGNCLHFSPWLGAWLVTLHIKPQYHYNISYKKYNQQLRNAPLVLIFSSASTPTVQLFHTKSTLVPSYENHFNIFSNFNRI